MKIVEMNNGKFYVKKGWFFEEHASANFYDGKITSADWSGRNTTVFDTEAQARDVVEYLKKCDKLRKTKRVIKV